MRKWVCPKCEKPHAGQRSCPTKTRERVAQCEEAITHLTRRLTALEARSPGTYPSEPRNQPDMWVPPPKIEGRGYSRKFETVEGDLVVTEEHVYSGTGFKPPDHYPPGYPHPFGGTTDEED